MQELFSRGGGGRHSLNFIILGFLGLTLLGGVFLYVEPSSVHAAGTPCSITPVLTEANLNTCIAEAPTDNSEFTITIGADFNITTQKAITAGKNITLTSTSPASPATLTRNPGYAGRLFDVNITAPGVATLTLDSVILDGNNQAATLNNNLVRTNGTGDVALNLTGNTILRNNNSMTNGAAVLIGATSSGSSLTVSGATKITDNNTTVRSGGIYVIASPATVVIKDQVEISSNTAEGYGGGVYTGSNNILNISGNVVISNNIANNGGGIFADGSTATISNGAKITNNTSSSGGGGILITGATGTFAISDTTISGNEAATFGGGIFVSNGTLNIGSGTIISNNTAATAGGVRIQSTASAVNMYAGATIRGNYAVNNGGGVSVQSTFNLYGGEISGNHAEGSEVVGSGGGGGVNVHGSAAVAKFNMFGGTISGNSAIVGGGVRMAEHANNTLDMTGGTISGNTAENGGGVWVGEGTANITSGTISGNVATMDGGGVYTEDYGNLLVGVGAIFAGNRAAFASPTRNPADDAVYAANILSINWTTPFTQGYNNYDINHDYAPEAPGTGTFGGQISGAVASVLSITLGSIAISVIFISRKLLTKRH